jgi:hypothetical protein
VDGDLANKIGFEYIKDPKKEAVGKPTSKLLQGLFF